MKRRSKKRIIAAACYLILLAKLLVTGWLASRLGACFEGEADVSQFAGRDATALVCIAVLYRALKKEFVGWNKELIPFVFDLNKYEFFQKGKGEAAELVCRTKRICAAMMTADAAIMLLTVLMWGIRFGMLEDLQAPEWLEQFRHGG